MKYETRRNYRTSYHCQEAENYLHVHFVNSGGKMAAMLPRLDGKKRKILAILWFY